MARKSRVATVSQVLADAADVTLAGLYKRISVEDGDDEKQSSLGNQEKIGIHFLTEHPDIKLVDTYSDNGYTGMNYNRPDFCRLMKDIQSGRINCIIVKDISRLGRHFIQTSEYVERIFPEMGIRLICINDHFDSNDRNADASSLTLPLKMVMNDYYVKDIAKKIRSGIDAKVESGEYIPSASSIPYGYIRNPEAITFDIDEEAAPVVRKIFELRASGMSINGIATVLNKDGVPSPGKLRYQRGITMSQRYVDCSWIRGTIRKILSDEVYLGHRIHGRIKGERYGAAKEKQSPEQWHIVRNAHPPIVSQELFDKALKVGKKDAEKRKNYKSKGEPQVNYRDIFRGKVFCGHCGSSMSACKGCGRDTSDVPAWLYYNCNVYKYSNHTKCSNHYIRQEKIMETVRNLLNQQAMVAVDVDALLTDIQNRSSTNLYVTHANERYRNTLNKRKQMEARIDQLLVDLTQRLIDRGAYTYMKDKYEKQLEDLIREEAKSLEDRNAVTAAITFSKQWVNTLLKFRAFPEITKELVDTLIDRVEVFDNDHIRVILKYADPYAALEKLLHHMEGMPDAV